MGGGEKKGKYEKKRKLLRIIENEKYKDNCS
jgi:hypothetical protein